MPLLRSNRVADFKSWSRTRQKIRKEREKKERRSENGIAVIIIVPSFHRLKLGNRINTNAGSGARGGRFAQAAADL